MMFGWVWILFFIVGDVWVGCFSWDVGEVFVEFFIVDGLMIGFIVVVLWFIGWVDYVVV